MATGSIWWALALVSLSAATPVVAQPVDLDIPAGDLREALVSLARQTGISVGMPGELPHHRSRRVRGRMEPATALNRLLEGTGARATRLSNDLWRIDPIARRGRQAAIENRPDTAPDIIVTATKRQERLMDTPIAISVIRQNGADAASAERGVHDAIASTEGAFTTNLGPGRDRIFLRGVADSAFNGPTQSTVGLYLDDIRISYATPDPDLRLVDIDRIEILRGPQGTLYGVGALGGIVRIIPVKPDLAGWGGNIALEGITIAHGAPGGAIEAVINAPIRQDVLGARGALYFDRTGGWIDDNGRNGRDVNAVKRVGGRIAVRWKPAPDWTIDVGFAGQWINARDSQYATAGLTRATSVAEPHDNDFLGLTATVSGPIAGLDFLSATGFVSHDVNSRFDATAVAASRGLPGPLVFEDDRKLQLITQEWRISDPDAPRPWVAGLSVLSAENRDDDVFTPSQGAPVPVLGQFDDALEAALFGEATQPLSARTAMTVGLRAFASKSHIKQQGRSREETHRTGLTPSATLSWHPSEQALIWLRYASAVRPGGVNPEGDANARAFESDELKSVELGWRLKLARGHVRLNGALFGLHWEAVQSDIVGVDGLVRTINAGSADNFGLEFGSTIGWSGWFADGSLTVQHARLTRPAAAANAVGDDNRLPVLPDFSGRLKFGFDRRVGDIGTQLFGTIRYMGPARLSFDPGLARSMGDYWVVGAGATASSGPWTLSLALTNLLDSRGDTFGFGNPFTVRMTNQQTPLQPRTITFRIERRF